MPGLLILVLLTQSGVAASDGDRLDRIRTAVSAGPAITTAIPDDGSKPVFRVNIEAWTFKGRPWDPDASIVPDYVRPTMPLAHYEYLHTVTPEASRASTLYHPILSVTFDPVIVRTFFARRRRAALERSAREEVRRDVEANQSARTPQQ
jgi:hypothetical protein